MCLPVLTSVRATFGISEQNPNREEEHIKVLLASHLKSVNLCFHAVVLHYGFSLAEYIQQPRCGFKRTLTLRRSPFSQILSQHNS